MSKHEFNIGDRIVHNIYGNGTIMRLPDCSDRFYYVEYDNTLEHEHPALDSNFKLITEETNMDVGTFVKSSEYGIGRITEMDVGVCNKYIRAKFTSGEHRVRAWDVTSLYATDRPDVGDNVFVCDKNHIGMGVVMGDDGSDLPFYVEIDEDCHYFYESEVTLTGYIKPRFNIGDIVRSNGKYCGKSFVGTVVHYCEGSSLIKVGRKITMLNKYIDKVEPEFNIGDKITGRDGTTVHTITEVRPNHDNTCICYDTKYEGCSVGSIYETDANAYIKSPKDERIEKLKEELKILKDASHLRNCAYVECDECPFHTESGRCASNAIISTINDIKE